MKSAQLRHLITSHAKRSALNRYDSRTYVSYAQKLMVLAQAETLTELPEHLPQIAASLSLDEVSSQQITQIAYLLLDIKHHRRSPPREPLTITCTCGKTALFSNHHCRYSCKGCNKLTYAHKGDYWPMGQLATAAVRYSRKQCHSIFEDKWVGRLGDTQLAYQRVSKVTGLSRTELHFGKIDSLIEAHRVMTALEAHAPTC